MKKAFSVLSFCMFAVITNAQTKVEKINLKGTDYTVNRSYPEEILGLYLYERGKNGNEPIIELKKDGTGYFQPHGVPKIPIEFWIDCDENGAIRKQTGINGRYAVTLFIKYGEGGNRNYASGTYDLMGVTVVADEKYAVIFGERYKTLP